MANSWQVGTMYIQPNGPNGLFRQPGGRVRLSYPQQQTSVNYYETTPFSELTGVFSAGCGHFQNYPTMQQEYDEITGQPVMLITCAICSFIQYTLPVEQALSTVQQPQVVI